MSKAGPTVIIENDRLLTTAQIADRLGLCTASVMRLVARGELRCLKLGHNTRRFRESDLLAYIRSKEDA